MSDFYCDFIFFIYSDTSYYDKIIKFHAKTRTRLSEHLPFKGPKFNKRPYSNNKKLQGASWVAVQQALTFWASLLPYGARSLTAGNWYTGPSAYTWVLAKWFQKNARQV